MRRLKWIIYGLLAVILMTGCSEKSSGDSAGDTTQLTDDNTKVTTGGFKGVVTVTQGSVEGIVVSVESLLLSATTDASGAFSYSGVTAGTYTLTISAENGTTTTREVTVTAGSILDMGSIAIETGKVVLSSLLNPIYYSNTAVLQGSINTGSTVTTASAKRTQATSAGYGSLYLVADSVLSGLSTAGISSLEAIPAPFSFKQVDISDDGSYRVDNLPAGTNYQLIYIDGTSGANLGDITLRAGSATTKNVDSIAPNIPTIPALIKSLDGTPLEGATLKIHQTGQVLTADATGLVTLANLPAGAYTFTVSAANYVAKVFSINLTASLSSLETIELNDQKGTVAGKVTIEGNDNHANIVVYAKAADGSVYTALTDEAGNYVFPALPVDTGYSIIATANGLKSTKVKDISVVADTTSTIASMTLTPLNTTTDGDLGSIVGFARFYGVTGLNHAGIIVSIEETDDEAITSRDGSFILNNLAEGFYTVNFTDSNHITQTYEVEVVTGAATKLAGVTLHKPDEELTVDLILNGNTDISTISQDLDLPTILSNGATVVWSTSVPSIISTAGTVTIPLKSVDNYTVTLTATVTLGSITTSKSFVVNVPPNYQPILDSIADIVLSEDFGTYSYDANATNLNGDAITYQITVDDPTVVSMDINSTTGLISITSINNLFGVVNVTVTAASYDLSDSVSFMLTVDSVNDIPVPTYSTFTTAKNITYDSVLTGNDVENSNLTYTVGTTPGHGVLSLESNGSFSYVPVTGYTGNDSFTYWISDGSASVQNTVAVVIKPIWSKITAGDQHFLAILENGTLWAWGYNNTGQVGDGTNANKTSPVMISVDTIWSDVFKGEHSSFAVKSDGTLWAWGQNYYAQLGDGTTVDKNTTTLITGTIWSAINSGGNHSLGIKNGSLWSWGDDFYGQLGNGSSSSSNVMTPTEIDTNTSWTKVAAGYGHSLAIKAGTLWSWGMGYFGQLGNGGTTNIDTPVQVGSDNTWESVGAWQNVSAGIKSDGTLWTWGISDSDRLGYTTYNGSYSGSACQTVPKQVGSDNNWSKVTISMSHTVALKNDGTLWAWGSNDSGQLGDGSVTTRQTPVQVGSDTDWQDVAAGQSRTIALKQNGTIWVWGNNGSGLLGVENNVDGNTSILSPKMLMDY